jgi:hypothetical protein
MLLNHYAPQFQWLQAKVRNILHGHQTATLARTASLVIFAFLAGCSNLPERNPVPVESTNIATIPGIPEARFWGDEWPKFSLKRLNTITEAELETETKYSGIYKKAHNYLAISGGGSNGAFGAGLLAGWSAAGTRPEFLMVTGVSTGALSAPFAFLGPEYDAQLKEVYTTTSTKDILVERGLIGSALADSMADTAPLRVLIAKYITPQVIAAIAREHKRGRRLYIGTVNLDAGRVDEDLGGGAAINMHLIVGLTVDDDLDENRREGYRNSGGGP